MKIFTATDGTQGDYPGDFISCIVGELVMPPPLICDRDWERPGDGCGCGRSWAGLSSHMSTTSAIVTESQLSLDDYTDAIAAGFESMGFGDESAVELAKHLTTVAESLPVGTVVGHRLYELYVRELPEICIVPLPAETTP